MQPSSSRAHTSEYSLTKKNKSQSQREYRSKENDGFSELRDALLLIDPFDSPLGRDATRHQLLIAAAKKLRNLADENEKLVLRLSATPTCSSGTQEPEMRIPHGTTAQNVVATGVDVAWSTQGYHSLSMASQPAPYENRSDIAGWSLESPPPFYRYGHQPFDTTPGFSYHVPPVTKLARGGFTSSML